MNKNRGITFLLGLLVLILVWSVFSWPLPRYVTEGIPASGRTAESPPYRYMVPGDHLQLLYNLWLGSDMLADQTPWFHNLYEFNTGDDDARYEFSTYYAPFSIMFAIGRQIAGQPFGWNLTGWLSLAFTLWFTWLLVARYVRDRWLILAASVISIALPYRWMTLLGGSPAGLGMMWVPLYYYALERMICERRWAAGLLAGVVLVVSEWVDTHVFFFCALTTPFWCLFAYWYHNRHGFPAYKEWWSHLKACLPFLLLLAYVAIQVSGINSGLENTHTGDIGRSLREVAIYSPVVAGILSWKDLGPSSDIYIGWVAIVLLGSGGLVFLFQSLRQKASFSISRILAFLLLLAGIYVITMLALGVNNPGKERAWQILTRLISPYSMIRQTSRVYTLLPTVMAVAFAIIFSAWQQLINRRWLPPLVCMLSVSWVCADYAHRIQPGLCLLDSSQAAYAAVHDDAEENQEQARAMAVPIWPGDSHWSSLYEYYSSLYRIRMLNGYRPSVRKPYFDDVYLRFESCNKGEFTDAQLDNLQERNIHYLILHENAFPEKVSPFAVSHTLQSMLTHPRLTLLNNSMGVWAFRIEKVPLETGNWMPDWPYACPARLWQAERSEFTNALVVESDSASGGRFLQMNHPGSLFQTSPYPMYSLSNLHFMVRMKGQGQVSAVLWPDSANATSSVFEVISTNWIWQKLPIPAFEGYQGLPVEYILKDGQVAVDVIMMLREDWPTDFNQIVLPAPIFFHAGYTDPETGNVVLSPGRDPADAIFYGPKIPWADGKYRVQLDIETPAPAGTLLGCLTRRYGQMHQKQVPVYAGQPAELLYEQTDNQRVAINFVYSRTAPMQISTVTIIREE